MTQEGQTFWVIEKHNEHGALVYVGDVALLESKRWYSIHHAIRFADRKSAEAVANQLRLSGVDVQEHMWADGRRPQEENA